MQDSSQIADSLLSFYQKSLLTMVFLGDELMRDKFAVRLSKTVLRLFSHCLSTDLGPFWPHFDPFRPILTQIFISDGIIPKLEASRYMDREDNENELKQVSSLRKR